MTSTVPSTPPSFLRALLQMAVDKVGPMLVPAGLLLADLGIAARRAALAELDQHAAELDERIAERSARLAAIKAEIGVAMGAAESTDEPLVELDDAAAAGAELLGELLGRPAVAGDFLAAGWTYSDALGWRPPNTPAGRAEGGDVAEGPGPLMWRENSDGPDDPAALRCAFDDAEVLTVHAGGDELGELICTKCERTAPETAELAAARVRREADAAAAELLPQAAEPGPERS